MGRTPRLVNPDEGPLQAFAHDLRELRENAGNPTYRALAKTAGFSASTLGEAAGGVRRPSLDVTLAFVGACGGDVAAWQKRWYQLDRQLTAEQLERAGQDAQEAPVEEPDGPPAVNGPDAADVSDAAHAAAAGAATTSGSSTASPATGSAELLAGPVSPRPDAPAAPLSSAPAPRRRARTALIAVAAVAVVSVLAFAGSRLVTGHASASSSTGSAASRGSATASASPCAVPGPKGRFSGDTRGSGARIRAGASMAETVVRTIAPFCQLQFDGYCLGDVVNDPLGGTPDMRWFEVTGGGVVSSAVIHGNPPAGLKPSTCPDSVPEPTSIALSAGYSKDSPGAFELHATGVHVWIVGFATVPGDRAAGPVPASAKWQQIGMVGETESGFTLAWSARSSGGTQPSGGTPSSGGTAQPTDGQSAAGGTSADRVPIVAVACYGGQGATDVMDPESVSMATPSDAKPLTLTPAQRAAAADAACSYPRP